MTDPNDDSPFNPDWASPPGHTIALRLMDRMSVSAKQLADALHLSLEELPLFVNGRIALTEEMAGQLSKLVGGTTDFWVRREAHYRDALARGCTDTGKTDPVAVPSPRDNSHSG